MAVSKVIAKVVLEIAHADGLNWRNVHNLAKQGIEQHLVVGGYIANAAEITKATVQSVADAGPNKETRWR